jgi:hypothetical protein
MKPYVQHFFPACLENNTATLIEDSISPKFYKYSIGVSTTTV